MPVRPKPKDINAGVSSLHLMDCLRVIWIHFPLVSIVFLLVMISAWVCVCMLPWKYNSSVIIQTKEDNGSVQIFGRTQAHHEKPDPQFTETQFQIIQGNGLLYQVIEDLNLMQKWNLQSREKAREKLRGMISVNEAPETDLIQISVLNGDRHEAADIANAIAETYQKSCIDEKNAPVDRSLRQLQNELSAQRARVTELQERMSKKRLEAKINDLNADSTEDSRQPEDSVLQEVENQVNDMRLRLAKLQARYKQVRALSDVQIIRTLKTLDINDPTISQLLPAYEACYSQEANMLSAGLGSNHPSVLALRAKRLVFARQLKDQVTTLRQSMASNLEITSHSLESMELKLTDARTAQQEARTKASQYQEAKKAYLEAKKILESMESRYSTQSMQRTMPLRAATVWEKAEASDFPAEPDVTRIMLFAFAAALILGVAAAFLVENFDSSTKSLQDLEVALGVPVLAIIPRGVAVLKDTLQDCQDAEGYRIMRANIEFNRKTTEANTIAVVSAGPGEGKSTTLNNLAFTFARGGYKTLIVDADLRRPSQHMFFNVSNEMGLSNYLTSEIPLDSLIISTGTENLSFLPSGTLPEASAGILHSQKMIDLVGQLRKSYEIVFFDSPPVFAGSDASIIASSVALTLIVVQHRRFPRAMLQRMKQNLEKAGATIIGCILNNTDVLHDECYEYYTNYYQYYGRQHAEENTQSP